MGGPSDGIIGGEHSIKAWMDQNKYVFIRLWTTINGNKFKKKKIFDFGTV